ncbi:hypothetical protein ACO0QE_002167 [Hanseniaspora vineae]
MGESLSGSQYAPQSYSPSSKPRYSAYSAYNSAKPAASSGINQHNAGKTTLTQEVPSSNSGWSDSNQGSYDTSYVPPNADKYNERKFSGPKLAFQQYSRGSQSKKNVSTLDFVDKTSSLNQSGISSKSNPSKHRVPGAPNTYVPSVPNNDDYIPASVNDHAPANVKNEEKSFFGSSSRPEHNKNPKYPQKNTYRSRFDSSSGFNKKFSKGYAFSSEKRDQTEKKIGIQETNFKTMPATFTENTTITHNTMPMSKKNFGINTLAPQSNTVNRVSELNHERKNRFADNYDPVHTTKVDRQTPRNQKETNGTLQKPKILHQDKNLNASSPSSKFIKSHKPTLINSSSAMDANNEHDNLTLSAKKKNKKVFETDSINGNEYTGGSKFIRSSSISNALSDLQHASDISESETDFSGTKNKTESPLAFATAPLKFTSSDLKAHEKVSDKKSASSTQPQMLENKTPFAKPSFKDKEFVLETATENSSSSTTEAAKTRNEENIKSELASALNREESQPLQKSSSILFNSDEDKKENEQDFDELLSSNLEGVPERDPQMFYYDAPFKSTRHIPKQLSYQETPLPEPKVVLNECIFPMREVELRLWTLKNNPVGLSKLQYRMKTPIKKLNEYPFFYTNIETFHQKDRSIIVENISLTKRYAYLKSLKLRQKYVDQESVWKEKIVSQLDKLTEQHKSKEEKNHEKKLQREEEELARNGYSQANSNLSTLDGADSGFSSQGASMSAGSSSRRRNRADFVDEEDLESVLLQIDPYYKHHQLAADIPPMILDPVEKYAKKYQDVNNLITNKDQWAERIILDGELNFSDIERKLFTEGYMQYPKLFSRISNYMGGLRTPEECVVYYYQTKNKCNYKQMLEEKKREKEREKAKRKLLKKMAKGDTSQNTPVKATELLETGVLSKTVSAVDLTDKLTVLCETQEQKTPQTHELPKQTVAEVAQGSEVDATETLTKQSAPLSVQGSDEKSISNDISHTKGFKLVDNTTFPSNVISDTNNLEKSKLNFNDAVEKPSLNNQTLDQTCPEPKNTNHISKEQINHVSFASPLANKIPDGQNEAIANLRKRRSSSSTTESVSFKLGKKQRPQNGDSISGVNAPPLAKTSYWTVHETNVFPSLLKKHGNDWEAISKDIETKSVIMVKNFYQKKASEYGWDKILLGSDDKQEIKKENSNEAGTSAVLFSSSKQGSFLNQNSLPAVTKPSVQLFSGDAQKQVLPGAESASAFFSDRNISLQGLPAPRLPSIQLPSIVPKNESPFSVFGSAQPKQGSTAASNSPSIQLPPIEPQAKTSAELRPLATDVDSGRSGSSATPTRKSFDIGNLLNESGVVHRPVLRTFLSNTNHHSRSASKSPSPVDSNMSEKNKSPPKLTFLSNILNPTPSSEMTGYKSTFDDKTQANLNSSFTKVNSLLNPVKPFDNFSTPNSVPSSTPSSQGVAVNKPTIISNPAISQAVLTATIQNPMISTTFSVPKPHTDAQTPGVIIPPGSSDSKPTTAFGNLNFAMDPLAALAAVASSESKLLNEKDSQSKQQSPSNP